MTIRSEDIDAIAASGGEVLSSNGDKLGKIGQFYSDDESGEPTWVTVKTGLFGMQGSFVPLGQATVSGADLVVPYDKDTVKGAPRVDDDGSITPRDEKILYSYYLGAASTGTGVAADDRGDTDVDRGSSAARGLGDRSDHDRLGEDRTDRDTHDRDLHDRDSGDRDSGDRDSGNRDTDGGFRSSKDQPDEEIGTNRLRRYVVTEKVVPVSREEVPVEDNDRR
jgi:hypothetical protein